MLTPQAKITLIATHTPNPVSPTISHDISDPTVTKTPTVMPSITNSPTYFPEFTQRPTQPGEAKFTKTAWSRGNSPNFKWFWIIEEEPRMPYFVTHFVNPEGNIEWFIHPEKGTSGSQIPNQPFFWLPKEPYVYLVGHGCCADGTAIRNTPIEVWSG